MPVFEYKALDKSGELIQGTVEADDPRDARSKLRYMGVYPTEVREDTRALFVDEVSLGRIWRRISKQELAVITRQLSTLLEAGLPLVQAISAVVEQLEDRSLKRVMADVRERVREGSSLSDALSKYPKVFSNLYVSLIKAGESSGSLDSILKRLAEYTERQVAIRNRIRATLAYPIIMVVVGIAVLSFLFTVVIPIVVKTFAEMERSLPPITMALIHICDFLKSKSFWLLTLPSLAIFILGIKLYGRTSSGCAIYDRIKLRIPILGKLISKMCLARFSRTLATLVGGGSPLLQSLGIVKDVVGNTVFSQAIDSASRDIGEGSSIAQPLKDSKVFPPMVIRMVAVGEESGNLEGMLLKVAEAYDNEVETGVMALTSLLEPLMILLMGMVVLFIVLAILLPIIDMNKIIR